MAKLKTDDMPAPVAASEAETPKAPVIPPKEAAPAPEPPAPKTPAKAKSALQGAEPTSEAEELLRLFPQYEALYIDRHGGVYSSVTPKNIRGEATLYKNPFYKPDKQ